MFKPGLWLRVLAVVACMLIGALPAQSDPTYELIDLGVLDSLPNAYSIARGINNQGQVTGRASRSVYRHTFLYSDGVMHDVGGLEGLSSENYGRAINEAGHIAGTSEHHPEAGAFLYRAPDDVEFLGTLGGDFSWAEDLNDFDQVVGRSPIDGFATHAFLWQDGVMTDLGTLGGPTAR